MVEVPDVKDHIYTFGYLFLDFEDGRQVAYFPDKRERGTIDGVRRVMISEDGPVAHLYRSSPRGRGVRFEEGHGAEELPLMLSYVEAGRDYIPVLEEKGARRKLRDLDLERMVTLIESGSGLAENLRMDADSYDLTIFDRDPDNNDAEGARALRMEGAGF